MLDIWQMWFILNFRKFCKKSLLKSTALPESNLRVQGFFFSFPVEGSWFFWLNSKIFASGLLDRERRRWRRNWVKNHHLEEGCSSTVLTSSTEEEVRDSASGKNLKEGNDLCLKFKKGMMLGPTFGRGSQLLSPSIIHFFSPRRKAHTFTMEKMWGYSPLRCYFQLRCLGNSPFSMLESPIETCFSIWGDFSKL